MKVWKQKAVMTCIFALLLEIENMQVSSIRSKPVSALQLNKYKTCVCGWWSFENVLHIMVWLNSINYFWKFSSQHGSKVVYVFLNVPRLLCCVSVREEEQQLAFIHIGLENWRHCYW